VLNRPVQEEEHQVVGAVLHQAEEEVREQMGV
jgi:hypothetical protein